jgi:hypothetical protein
MVLLVSRVHKEFWVQLASKEIKDRRDIKDGKDPKELGILVRKGHKVIKGIRGSKVLVI